MALKDNLRRKRSKRFGYVSVKSTSDSEEMNFSSSDSDAGETLNKTKVREGISVRNLRKQGENFKVDEDHIYTTARPHENLLRNADNVRDTGKVKRRRNTEENDVKPAKQRCASKNAINARLNRERKKKYTLSLETENNELRKQNNEISKKIQIQNHTISSMRREIIYLKSLLVNSKEISQIMQNLREATGLPITSSLKFHNKSESKDNNVQEKESMTVNGGSQIVGDENYHPRTRSVNCGSSYPILDKDICLSSSSDTSMQYSDLPDMESPPFDFENDLFDSFEPQFNSEIPNDSLFDFYPQSWDFDHEQLNCDESLTREAGICLHVSQKRISIEMCSICNSKAASSMLPLTEV